MHKFGEIEESTQSDSATGKNIRVSTTARIRFREIFPDYASERNMIVNEQIASVFNNSASNIMHYFKLGRGTDEFNTKEYAEIRGGPANTFFISAVSGQSIDIITIQSSWKIPSSGRGRKKLPTVSSLRNNLSDKKTIVSIRKNMNKIANIQAIWPQIYSMLKNPPQGINLGPFSSKLPPISKFKIEMTPNPTSPQAVGFVTTEDANNDGTLDTIHISSERFMQELERNGIGRNEISMLNQLSKDRLVGLLSAFVDVISHEMRHLNDYKHDSDNPFPGGEGIAEQAGNLALQQISVATNKNNSNINRRHEMSVLKILANLADELDKLNEVKAADIVTRIMIKKSQDLRPGVVPTLYDNEDRATYTRRQVNTPLHEEIDKQPAPWDVDHSEPAALEAKIEEVPVMRRETIGTLGKIRPDGDPFTYNYLMAEEVFQIASYTSGKGEIIPSNIRNVIGKTISKQSNPRAWDILRKYITIPDVIVGNGEPQDYFDYRNNSADDEPSEEDFALALTDSVEDIHKKASENVRRLESLFSLPGVKGPFGRER